MRHCQLSKFFQEFLLSLPQLAELHFFCYKCGRERQQKVYSHTQQGVEKARTVNIHRGGSGKKEKENPRKLQAFRYEITVLSVGIYLLIQTWVQICALL